MSDESAILDLLVYLSVVDLQFLTFNLIASYCLIIDLVEVSLLEAPSSKLALILSGSSSNQSSIIPACETFSSSHH